jgi:hypothetical protein
MASNVYRAAILRYVPMLVMAMMILAMTASIAAAANLGPYTCPKTGNGRGPRFEAGSVHDKDPKLKACVLAGKYVTRLYNQRISAPGLKR